MTFSLGRHSLAVALATLLLIVCRVALAVEVPPGAIGRPASKGGSITRVVILCVANAGPRLVAVGERGLVLLSDDNGLTWQQATAVPTSVTLTRVRFVDDKEGWAVGHMGVILHTIDGGVSWVKQLDGIEAASLAVADAKRALQQQDAGRDEAELQKDLRNAEALVHDGPDKPFLSLEIENRGTCLAFGAFGYAFSTEDGGRSWTALFSKTEATRGRHVYGVARLDDTLYLTGEEGLLLQSTRAGVFEPIPIQYGGTLFGIVATTKSVLLIYGLQGTILRRDPATLNWTEVKSGTSATLTSGLVLGDGRVALGSQDGQVITSSDGGITFTRLGAAEQPVTGLAQAADGSLIVTGPRGISRIDLRKTAGTK